MKVSYTIEALPEDMSVRGNAMASGDDAYDKEVEDAIIADLEAGNEWAWCTVKVTCTLEISSGHTWTGEAYLSGCSYRNERDFLEANDYAEQMKHEAYEDALAKGQRMVEAGIAAAEMLKGVGK
jgi:hypothetical protein